MTTQGRRLCSGVLVGAGAEVPVFCATADSMIASRLASMHPSRKVFPMGNCYLKPVDVVSTPRDCTPKIVRAKHQAQFFA